MGVKGLHSLLADDPRRFGVRWTLAGADAAEDDSNISALRTIVYIDGPALLHHLLAAYPALDDGRRDAMSIPPVENVPSCLYGQVSPEAVYVMAQAFATSLVAAGVSEVHLVRDGLASEFKSEAQMSRLADACSRADLAARQLARRADDKATLLTNDSRAIGAWDVPHLFAEMAMEEAFVDLMAKACIDGKDGNKSGERIGNKSSGPFFLHQAHGEAEGYICHLIESRRIGAEHEESKDDEDIIILSNDTDMFVYNVPCFVPLHSLRFEPMTSTTGPEKETRCIITGWRYCRVKFLAAFPKLVPRFAPNVEESFATMAAVSAVAGNDYSLPPRYRSALSSARTQIVQSDIGGLRRRERNAPTAKGTVTAVIRFVCHFASRDKRLCAAVIATDASNSGENKSGWMWQLASAATPDGKKRNDRESDLFEALCLVQKIYSDDATVGDEESLMSWLPQINNIEIERCVRRSSFFCRVVMETLGHSPSPSRGASKVKKKRRVVNTKRNQSVGKKRRKSGGGDYNEMECSSKSIWRAPEFVALRESLYDLLAYYLRNVSGNQINHLISVQEYCRVGMENFKDTATYIPSPPARLSEGNRCRDILEYCFVHDDKMIYDQAQSDNPLAIDLLSRSLEEIPERLWHPFLTAMLLSVPSHVLLFFLMACAPKGLTCSSNDAQTCLSSDLLGIALKLQVAVYHSNLVFDAINLFFPSNGTDGGLMAKLGKMRPSLFFRDALLSTLWSIIIMEEEIGPTGECNLGEAIDLDSVLKSVERNLKPVNGQVGLDEWMRSIRMFWEHYLLCRQVRADDGSEGTL